MLIDEGFHAEGFQIAQPRHRARDESSSVERTKRIEFNAGKRSEQVLVHQGPAKRFQLDRTQNGLNGRCHALL